MSSTKLYLPDTWRGAWRAIRSPRSCLVYRTCALFSNSKYRNYGIHVSHNILTRDGTPPAEFRKLACEQISSYHAIDSIDAKITEAVNMTRKARTGFEVFDSKGQKWRDRTLVFAMGCKDIFPAIDGYKENWPHNM